MTQPRCPRGRGLSIRARAAAMPGTLDVWLPSPPPPALPIPSRSALLYSVPEWILRHLEDSWHPHLDKQAWGRGPSPVPSAGLGEPGGERTDCAGPGPGWTQPSLKATATSPAPRPRPSHLPGEPLLVVTCAALAATVHLLPARSSVAPLPSVCRLPRMGCQRFAVVFVCEFWPREPAGTREAPSPPLVHGKRPSSLAAAPHLSLLLSPRCQLGGNWHGRSPASFLQLGVATLLFFFFCILNTHTYSHTHTHTRQAPPPPATRIPSVRSSPSQESPEAGGGREPGCRAVKTPAPSSSLPLL